MKGPVPTAWGRRVVLAAALDSDSRRRTLAELELLTKTAGGAVLGRVTQKLARISPATLVGRGKVSEIRSLAEGLRANLVVFDNVLSPAQTRNLEEALGLPVMDRTELILDVFATHARTAEAKMQVELARLDYMMPRLVGRRKAMEQIMVAGAADGGIAAGRGPGEKQIEYDRRLIRRRIFELKADIRQIQGRRDRTVRARTLSNFALAIVGYTNAGKSTLMKALTGAEVTVTGGLFSTLDTKTKTWRLRAGLDLLVSDTVGFIRDLPHALVTSFYATLAEIREVHLLLHVADATDPDLDSTIATVQEVLARLGAADKPSILILSKFDALPSPVERELLRRRWPDAVFVSALARTGFEDLEKRVMAAISDRLCLMRLRVPVTDGRTLAEIMGRYAVSRNELVNDEVEIDALIPRRDAYKFARFTDHRTRSDSSLPRTRRTRPARPHDRSSPSSGPRP